MADPEAHKAESPIYLLKESLLSYRVNLRVVQVSKDHERNQAGVPFLAFCDNDKCVLTRKQSQSPYIMNSGISADQPPGNSSRPSQVYQNTTHQSCQ